MTPIDYRNESFEMIRGRVEGLREVIWRHLDNRGEALSTRQIALETGIDLLTVRPRVTELVQLGFVECGVRSAECGVEEAPRSREGRYRACSEFMARQRFDQERRKATETQLSLF